MPPHTASQSSLGAISFGGKNQTYQQRYQVKQALNSKPESDTQKQSKPAEDCVIRDFLADVLPSQSQSVVEAAQRAIMEFDLTTKSLNQPGLVTPPAHSPD